MPATHVSTARADSRATDRAVRSRREESLRSTSGHGARRPARTAAAARHDRGSAGGRRRLQQPVERRPALPIGATSEPRDQRQNQNTPGGGADGVGEEYAISAAANPAADQSAHRRSAHPNRRRSVSPALEGVFCHAAKGSAERKGRTPPQALSAGRL